MDHLSRVKRNPVFHMRKQRHIFAALRVNAADQRLCDRYIDSTIPILPKSEIASLNPASVDVQSWYESIHYVFIRYTPKNNLRTTQLTFPYVVYLVSSVAQSRQDIEKRFCLPKSQNKVVPVKNLALNIFIFILSKICISCLIFK